MGKKTTIEDVILDWFRNDDGSSLDEKHKGIYQQCLFIWGRMAERVRQEKIVKQCQKMFPISRQSVYNRIRLANKLFGNAVEINRDAEKLRMIGDLQEALNWAKDARDYKGVVYISTLYAKITNLSNEDGIIPHFENIQRPDIQINISEAEKAVALKLLNQGSLNLDDLQEAMEKVATEKRSKNIVEDIEFEQVK